jgi:hypothetical protein
MTLYQFKVIGIKDKLDLLALKNIWANIQIMELNNGK